MAATRQGARMSVYTEQMRKLNPEMAAVMAVADRYADLTTATVAALKAVVNDRGFAMLSQDTRDQIVAVLKDALK